MSNQIKGMPVDSNLTCSEATVLITKYQEISPEEFNIALAVLAKCKAIDERSKSSESNAISVGYYDKSKERILFEIIDYKSGEDIKNASRYLVDLYISNVANVDPISSSILYLGADYSIEAFFEAAVKNDPMIILAPLTIPGTKLGKDTIKELARFGKKSEKFIKKQGGKVKDHFEKNPEDLILPGSSLIKKPAKKAKKLLRKLTGIKL